MELSRIALQGIEQAQTKLEKTASRLSAIGAQAAENTPADTVEISAEMVALMEARNENAIYTKLAQTADEVQRTTLDILA